MTFFYTVAAALFLVSITIPVQSKVAADDLGDHQESYYEETELHNDAASHHDPWLEVIIAALLINMTTLIGVVILTGKFCFNRFTAKSEQDAVGSTGGDDQTKTALGSWKFTSNIIPSFAAGALLATCSFLMFPEAFFMISKYQLELAENNDEGDPHAGHSSHRLLEEQEVGDEHNEHGPDIDIPVALRFGVSILGGFLIPMVASLLFSVHNEPLENEEVGFVGAVAGGNDEVDSGSIFEGRDVIIIRGKSKTLDDAKIDNRDDASSTGSPSATMGEDCELAGCHKCLNDIPPGGASPACSNNEQQVVVVVDGENKVLTPTSDIDYSLAASVLVGDFFHNFTDGVLIGTAFLLCNRELAIAISAATVYHEIAQELADYLLLTKTCRIRPGMALFLNFISGLSVMIGALLILVLDINSNTTGCILAVGGGVYIFVAAGECIPRVLQSHRSLFDKIVSLVSFVVGAVPIGLVLLNHGHCDA
jgi:zinc transporter ZupT